MILNYSDPPENEQEKTNIQNSQRKSKPNTKIRNKQNIIYSLAVCAHHELELVFYCESCEEPICRQCTILGPHNNQLHRVNQIEQAFKARNYLIAEAIRDNLVEKREKLLAQIHRIEYRIEELRYVKTIIERETRGEYGGILERLKSAQGNQITVLQHQMKQLQKDIDIINDIGSKFNELTKNPTDPLTFLLQTKALYASISSIKSKEFKKVVDVSAENLPKQLTDMRLLLEQSSSQEQVIDIKQRIIWNLVNEKQHLEEFTKKTIKESGYKQINEWEKQIRLRKQILQKQKSLFFLKRLTVKFSNELKDYQMICYYCGIVMDKGNVNSQCPLNDGFAAQNQAPAPPEEFTEKKPYIKFNGNHRHFFSKPQKDYLGMIQEFHDNKKGEKEQNPFLIFLQVQFTKIRKNCQENGIDLNKTFKLHDQKENGTITHIQAAYILSEIMGISPIDTDRIIQFVDKDQKGVINYKMLLEMINKPKTIQEFLQNTQ